MVSIAATTAALYTQEWVPAAAGSMGLDCLQGSYSAISALHHCSVAHRGQWGIGLGMPWSCTAPVLEAAHFRVLRHAQVVPEVGVQRAPDEPARAEGGGRAPGRQMADGGEQRDGGGKQHILITEEGIIWKAGRCCNAA